jgi:type IV secretory pathway TraG/TraD family ATPase VirD4
VCFSCTILFNEFANIGQIPRFEKLIATIHSREISACVILQAQSQLKSIYKDNSETIISNMDSRIFFGGTEKITLKNPIESFGKETVYTLNGVKRGHHHQLSPQIQLTHAARGVYFQEGYFEVNVFYIMQSMLAICCG